MSSTKSFYIKFTAALLTCCSFVVFGQTASDMKRAQLAKKQMLGNQGGATSFETLRREIPLFQLIRQKSSSVVNAEFNEVKRAPLRGINTDKLDMMKTGSMRDIKDVVESEQATLPSLSSLVGNATMEFYDITTRRAFQMTASKAEMAKFSSSVSKMQNLSNPLDRLDRRAVIQDEQVKKAWSGGVDNRTRRAIADGYSDTNPIYQRLANYGGCSATVLSANSQRMVALTAGHCVFATQNTFSNSVITPRRDGSTVSPTWGTWTPVGFGYYTSYRDLNCEGSYTIETCAKHDIALVIAVPNSGATPPKSMGWAYGSKSWLEARNKYRRGYPGCGSVISPPGCTTDNLYGDGAFSIGSLADSVAGWNRVMWISSDANHGDSGSGSYFYESDYPYVFSALGGGDDCWPEPTTCGSHPVFTRRITPDFFDFINDVVF